MKKFFVRQLLIILFGGFLLGSAAKNIFAQNSLNGLIFDRNRNPVVNIDVELLDEFERLIRSTKTSSGGIYIFQGIRAGIFYVQVRVDGTNFKPVKERIQIGQTNFTNSTTGGISGSESLQLNFVLETDSRRTDEQTPLKNEVIFAQNVPDEAKMIYEKAVKTLDDKKQAEGILFLQNAIEIFPEYFLALNRLGYEYLENNKFAEAETAFEKALKTNQKSFSSSYGLAVAHYKLGKKSEAIQPLEAAISVNPGSINSYFLLGKIYREIKEYDKAEKNLKKAEKLSQNKLPDIHWELALLYYHNLQRYNEAAEELELYLKANPEADNKTQIIKLIKTMREKAKR